MADPRLRSVDQWYEATIRLQERMRRADPSVLLRAADALARAAAEQRRILVFGNGGSAADAQHFVTELVGRFRRERRPLAAVALTADTSLLTAVANDFGFAHVFARQIEALGASGDVAVAITTSGASPNVIEGLRSATARGLTTIALTGGDGGEAGRIAAVHLNVPDADTAHVQEAHITLLHVICLLIEETLDRAPLAPGA